MKHKRLARILALDLHPRSFGYVVIESPTKLLDWGVCSCRRKSKPSDVLIQRRLRPLLQLLKPTLLVIRSGQQIFPRQKLLRERFLKGVVAEARTYRACVRQLRSTEGRAEKLTKYERAREAAERFPVLVERLPLKRKPWESAYYSMSIFEALAIAVTHLGTPQSGILGYKPPLPPIIVPGIQIGKWEAAPSSCPMKFPLADILSGCLKEFEAS